MKHLVGFTAPLFAFILMFPLAIAMLFESDTPNASAAAICDPANVSVEFASTILSQVPVGANVTHRARVRSNNCDLEGVTLTIVPPGAQSFVSIGPTGPWDCDVNPDQSVTCTRPVMAARLVSTLTLVYQQGPYQDSNGRLHGCVTADAPSINKCNQAYFKALP